MKKILCIIMSIMFLAGCSSTVSVSQNKNTGGTGNAFSGNGTTVAVKGGNSDFKLHSIDFLDENTGWIIQDRNNSSNKTYSQLLETQDGGSHWNKIGPDNMTLEKVMFIDRKTGWAISRIGDNTSQIQHAILYTQDGGADWNIQWQGKKTSTSTSNSNLWFQDNTYGFALIGDELLATRNGGKQWSSVLFKVDSFVPQKMSFADAETGWVVGVIGQKNIISVLHTNDGGNSWQQQFTEKYPDGPAGSIGIDFINAKTGWFLTSNMATWTGELYYTDNAGGSWQKINKIKCIRPTPTSINFISPQVGWIPLDPGAGPIGGGLMFTRDGGKSFNVVGRSQGIDPFITQKIISAREVDFISGQQGWAVGMNINYGDYLVRTIDGGKTWVQVYPKLMPINDISFVDNQHGFGLGQLSDPGSLLYTSDGGENWECIKSFTQNYWPERLSFIDRNNGWLMASSVASNKPVIFKTADGGKTWIDISESNEISGCYFKFFDADNGLMIDSGKENTIFRTGDGGKTWEASDQKPPANGISQFSFISGSEGWEICNPGNYKTKYDIMISHTADGVAWQTPIEVEQGACSYAFSFLSDRKAMLLIEEPPFGQSSRMKLLMTEDAGKTWISHILPEGINGFTLVMLQNQLPMQFTDDLHGWILSAHGLLATQDGGKTWTWL